MQPEYEMTDEQRRKLSILIQQYVKRKQRELLIAHIKDKLMTTFVYMRYYFIVYKCRLFNK